MTVLYRYCIMHVGDMRLMLTKYCTSPCLSMQQLHTTAIEKNNDETTPDVPMKLPQYHNWFYLCFSSIRIPPTASLVPTACCALWCSHTYLPESTLPLHITETIIQAWIDLHTYLHTVYPTVHVYLGLGASVLLGFVGKKRVALLILGCIIT